MVLTADPAVYGDPAALLRGAAATLTPEGSVRVTFPDGTAEDVQVGPTV